jgi:hypothetical protein
MKKILFPIVAVLVAILVVVSSGCLSPSSGSSAPSVTVQAAGVTTTGTPAVPDNLPASTPSPTTAAQDAVGGRQAATGDLVSVYLTVMFENGTVIDSNMNATEPIAFTLGNSSVPRGFENAVTGMSVNQEKTVLVPYGDAYGAYDASLVRTVNRIGPLANTSFEE